MYRPKARAIVFTDLASYKGFVVVPNILYIKINGDVISNYDTEYDFLMFEDALGILHYLKRKSKELGISLAYSTNQKIREYQVTLVDSFTHRITQNIIPEWTD